MQFDLQRAFPYPVLRPDVNDYTDGEFQANVDVTQDGKEVKFDVQFALSVDEINAAIVAKKASFVTVVSCRDTYFREAIKSNKPMISKKFETGDLRGEVQISSYVVGDIEIKNFESSLINKEFGSGPFSFPAGSVLALDEPKIIYIDRELFKPITSVFQLVKKESLQGAEWHVDFSGNKVQIGVSASMKAKLDSFRNSPRNKAILLNSIYFAAVMQAISVVKEHESDHLRWAQVIVHQCHNMNIDIESHHEYLIAEQLMKHPLGLMETYLMGEES